MQDVNSIDSMSVEERKTAIFRIVENASKERLEEIYDLVLREFPEIKRK